MSVEERLRGLEQFKELLLNVMDVFPNGIRLKQTTTILNHDPVTLDANADAVLGITGQQITVDKQTASKVLISPISTTPEGDYPTFRKLVADDLPERWHPLTTPLTSTAWDGDARSTTAKTVIDLSAVFGVPANAKMVKVKLSANDSASSTTNCFAALAPNDTADLYQLVCKPCGLPNDIQQHEAGDVNCDANGDIYFQCLATGSGTLDVTLQIWGYYI